MEIPNFVGWIALVCAFAAMWLVYYAYHEIRARVAIMRRTLGPRVQAVRASFAKDSCVLINGEIQTIRTGMFWAHGEPFCIKLTPAGLRIGPTAFMIDRQLFPFATLQYVCFQSSKTVEAHVSGLGDGKVFEEAAAPSAAQIITEKYRHQRKDGGADGRYSENPRLSVEFRLFGLQFRKFTIAFADKHAYTGFERLLEKQWQELLTTSPESFERALHSAASADDIDLFVVFFCLLLVASMDGVLDSAELKRTGELLDDMLSPKGAKVTALKRISADLQPVVTILNMLESDQRNAYAHQVCSLLGSYLDTNPRLRTAIGSSIWSQLPVALLNVAALSGPPSATELLAFKMLYESIKPPNRIDWELQLSRHLPE